MNNILELLDALSAELVAAEQWSYSLKLEKIKALVVEALEQKPAFPEEPIS